MNINVLIHTAKVRTIFETRKYFTLINVNQYVKCCKQGSILTKNDRCPSPDLISLRLKSGSRLQHLEHHLVYPI